MKKLLAAILAAVTLLSPAAPALAAGPAAGSQAYAIYKVTGNPVDGDGKQFNANDTIDPGQTIYYALPETMAAWVDSTSNFRLSTRKTSNGKLIKSIKLVEKKLTGTSGASTIYIPNQQDPTSKDYASYKTSERRTYLAVELADTAVPEELKVQFTAAFTAKKPVVLCYGKRKVSEGETETVKTTNENGAYVSTLKYLRFFDGKQNDRLTLTGNLYVANPQEEGDATVTVGSKGVMIKPERNSVNEITFEGEDTIATLTFRANNNPRKFLARLTTSWPTTALSNKFRNTDAVIRKFSPATIDATSRATLALANPFAYDEVDPEDVYIYTADSKGNLKDITRTVNYNEDEDTFKIQTRTLTTYIISDKKVRTKAK